MQTDERPGASIFESQRRADEVDGAAEVPVRSGGELVVEEDSVSLTQGKTRK